VTEDAAAAGLPTAEHVTFANWVLVQFAGKKSSKYIVGQIVEDTDLVDVKVKFLKKSRQVFLWPNVEDISDIPRKDIVRKLAEPQCDKHGRLTFVEKLEEIL